MSYFVIHTNDNGVTIEDLDKATLLERLADNYYGDVEASSLPGRDPEFWGDGLVIIKGTTVFPKVMETVTTWDVE